jgi:predicted dehydrogenase
MHCKIAEYALEKGLPLSVEKPIGLNFEEAKSLAKKSKKTGLPVFVCFSWRYRNFPRYMKYLIDKGEIGDIYHINVKSIKNSGLWNGRRLEWRFDKEKAGSGVLCDLGSHMFDVIRFFGQEFKSVYCDNGIIVKRRQKLNSEEWADVTTDDWDNITCKLESGIGANIFVSRCLTTENEKIKLEVVGSKGTLKFSYDNGVSSLIGCIGKNVKNRQHIALEMPPEFSIGGQSEAFINMLLGKKDKYTATIEEGLKSQAAVDAALLSSIYGRAFTIEEMLKD